jgi:hypothetical protein
LELTPLQVDTLEALDRSFMAAVDSLFAPVADLIVRLRGPVSDRLLADPLNNALLALAPVAATARRRAAAVLTETQRWKRRLNAVGAFSGEDDAAP